MKPLLALLSLVWLAGCGAASGSPEACAVVLESDVPVRFVRRLQLVEITLNGKPLTMQLDTGSNASVITESAFDRLNLASDSTTRGTVTGMGGVTSHPLAVVDSLGIGTTTRRNLSLFVAVRAPFAEGAADGLLGRDVLGRFDIDLDLPHRRLGLYRQRDCPGAQPGWTGAGAGAAELLPPAPQGRALPPTMIAAQLNGVGTTALLDTGATNSFADRALVLAGGVTADALAKDRTQKVKGATDAESVLVVHRFDSLTIGSETIPHADLSVTGTPQSFGIPGVSMILGNDYLRDHRIWIAFGNHQTFVARPAP